MVEILNYFKEANPVTLILISFVIGLVSVFIEKPFPSVFLGLRLLIFFLFIYAVVKYFSKTKV